MNIGKFAKEQAASAAIVSNNYPVITDKFAALDNALEMAACIAFASENAVVTKAGNLEGLATALENQGKLQLSESDIENINTTALGLVSYYIEKIAHPDILENTNQFFFERTEEEQMATIDDYVRGVVKNFCTVPNIDDQEGLTL
jgi:hypothetical protein